MEIKDFLRPFFKKWWFIFSLSLGGFIIALVISFYLPVKYRAQKTFFVSQEPEETEDFSYDGFYAQKSAQEFTNVVVGMMESPDFVWRVSYKFWGSDLSVSELPKGFKIEKTGPQIISFSVTRKDLSEALGLAEAMEEVLSEEASLIGEQTEIQSLTENFLTREVVPLRWLNSLVGAMAGLILSVVSIGFWEYLLKDL